MKKYLYLIIFAIILIPTINAKAYTLVCSYDGVIRWDYNSDGAYVCDDCKDTLYLYLEDGYTHADFSTFFDIPSVDSEFVGDKLKNHLYYEFLSDYLSASKEYDPDSMRNVVPVYWDDYEAIINGEYVNARMDMINFGYCPMDIYFGVDQGFLESEEKAAEFRMGYDYDYADMSYDNPSSEYNKKHGKPMYQHYHLKANSLEGSNYYPHEEGLGNYVTLFLRSNLNLMKTNAETCVIDTEKLAYMTDLFNLNVVGFMSKTSKVDQVQLRRWMKNAGYVDIAQKVIDNYGSTSECYQKQTALQDIYLQLVDAADTFITNVGGDSDAFEVSSCEEIIGNGTFASYLNQAFRFIQFVGPVLVIVLSIFEYIKIIASGDSDALKKQNKRTVTRIVFALLLFLIPIILKFILNILGFYGDCLDSII